ncbi:glycosyltransferase family 2 protein [Dyadobacter psychrotolerans]|uniref:Glycosyltransferase n=1 Tax=Dyadobacter psychrotolerans TaxID=2541721 RepID=A0A4R5DXM4_9BACT|nr:glycosyltransferase [Dyadobacter psychrotolerans]TDE18687.1 glycosyltransferase [Dyadobacter psychrotolerans]
MHANLVSVVMPCYNCEKYVTSAIKSILDQSYANLELIVIDDGSTDGTLGKIKDFRDSRICLIGLKQNRGNYAARNIGMKAASGEYICVMDADDVARPERLQRQLEFLKNNQDVGCVGSQATVIDEAGNGSGRIFKPVVGAEELAVLFLIDNFTLHPSLMLRHSLLKRFQLFYDESYLYASDFDFVSRCAQYFPVVNTAESLMYYRKHASQISSDKKLSQKACADKIRLSQLNKFDINLTLEEQAVYLKLFDNTSEFISTEIENVYSIVNLIVNANSKQKNYNQAFMLRHYRNLLVTAKDREARNLV